MARFDILQQLVEYFIPDKCVGVEIGVDQAETSVFLLDNMKLEHLYCIDPYNQRDSRYEKAQNLLKKYDNCTLIRAASHEASSIVPDNLDFVFIDGDHSYEAVLLDFEDWVPKVRSGGLVSGHDWTSFRSSEVPKAGTEYLLKNPELFKPMMSDQQLKSSGLPFKLGGVSFGGIVHKQRNAVSPVWWRLKK